MRLILVDGYNAIRSSPTLVRLEDRSLEEARSALIAMVSASPRFQRDSVVIIFDGAMDGRTFASGSRLGHISVQFSPRGRSADDVIKERARQAPDPSAVVIVTNDLDIKLYCQGLGCSTTSPENMLSQATTPKSIRRARIATPEQDDDFQGGSTKKKGNPRRLPKKARRPKTEYRF